LISLESIDTQKQADLLNFVQSPLLARVQAIVAYAETNAINSVLIWELSDLITAIGSISKGFPDYNPATHVNVPWSASWKSTLQGVLIVLGKFNQHKSIREAARYSLQRMAGCMGPELLDYVPIFFSSGLLSTDSAGELTEFLPFIGLVVHKFQQTISPMLTELWQPLRAKLTAFLNQPPIGTDDTVSLIALRRADLTLLAVLFNSELDTILTAPVNLPSLPSLLDQVLSCLDEISDLPTKKLVVSLLGKMTHCWSGSEQSPTLLIAREPSNSQQKEKIFPKHPLQGFDAFVYERIVPLTFTPLSPTFPLSDSAAHAILTEIALLHQTAMKSLGQPYVTYISQTYLPSFSCPASAIEEFVAAMTKDKRVFRAALLVCFVNVEILQIVEGANVAVRVRWIK
jgi:exportin-T